MLLNVRILIVTTLVMLVGSLGVSRGSETGTVTGKVVYVGDPPQVNKIEITRDTEKCGTEKLLEEIVVGPDQGLQWAVVSLLGAEGSAERETAELKLDQNGCRFTPHVVVVPPGADLTVLNSDGILHNVHTHSEKNRSLNRAQPGVMKKMKMKFDETEIVKVACDVHSWMSAWIVVSDSPHIAVTDENGSFELAGVNPGTYKLKLWHEVLGEQAKEVTVKGGEETRITFELTL